MMLGGFQSRSGQFGEEKYLSPLPEIESQFLGHSAHSLVAVPLRYPGCIKNFFKKEQTA
jgi:hypothetical protein